MTNPQSIHQTAQGIGMNVEDGSRTVGSADHPPGPVEHAQNMLALYVIERI